MASWKNIIANKQKNCNLKVRPAVIHRGKVVITEVASTEAVITHVATTDGEKLFVAAINTTNLTTLARSFILLALGQLLYFVATGRPGWYYIINPEGDETTTIPPCTCVQGLNHEQCPHIADVAQFITKRTKVVSPPASVIEEDVQPVATSPEMEKALTFITWVQADKARHPHFALPAPSGHTDRPCAVGPATDRSGRA